MIRICCDHCGAEHQIPEQYQGKKVKCARCAHIFRAPESFGLWRDVLTSAVKEFGNHPAQPTHQSK